MMIYSIKLSKSKKESDFERFMLEDIFPAVDKSSRRDGQVEGLSLLKGNNTGSTNEYLWLVYGTVSGRGAANQQVDEIKAFGASVSPMLDYVERGSWFATLKIRVKKRRSAVELLRYYIEPESMSGEAINRA